MGTIRAGSYTDVKINSVLYFQVKTRLGKVFNIWDVGGQDKTRPLWRSYTRCTDAIIFVEDSFTILLGRCLDKSKL